VRKQPVLIAHSNFPLAHNSSAQRNKFLPSAGSLFQQNGLALFLQQVDIRSGNCSSLSFQNKFHRDKNLRLKNMLRPGNAVHNY
jgi:hypothetical protein